MPDPEPVDFRLDLRRWIPDEMPPEGQWAALVRLSTAVRGLTEVLVGTDSPEEDLTAAAELVEAALARIVEHPRTHRLWGFAEASTAGNTKAMFDSSPISGMANPVAPPLRLEMEGNAVVGRVIFGTAYEGPPAHVHGGWVSAAFDEVLGMVQSTTGQPGMTGTLSVKYRAPTPLYREVRFRGWVDRVEGRKIFTTATLHDGDRLCAEAEGIFISIDWQRMRALAGM